MENKCLAHTEDLPGSTLTLEKTKAKQHDVSAAELLPVQCHCAKLD